MELALGVPTMEGFVAPRGVAEAELAMSLTR